jgi:hypothetical protein
VNSQQCSDFQVNDHVECTRDIPVALAERCALAPKVVTLNNARGADTPMQSMDCKEHTVMSRVLGFATFSDLSVRDQVLGQSFGQIARSNRGGSIDLVSPQAACVLTSSSVVLSGTQRVSQAD